MGRTKAMTIKIMALLGVVFLFALVATLPMTVDAQPLPPGQPTPEGGGGFPPGAPGGEGDDTGFPPGFPGTGDDGGGQPPVFPPVADQQATEEVAPQEVAPQEVAPQDVAPPQQQQEQQEQQNQQQEQSEEVTDERPALPEVEANVTDTTQIAFDVRIDLDSLANATLGGTPEGWSGVTDFTDPQFAILTRIDLELLAGALLGADNRPDGWFGAVGSTTDAIVRDLRHDLELLADEFGRPGGWVGAGPLLSCDRTTQAIVQFLELNGVFTLQADRTAPDFCEQAALEASLFMEVNLLGNPTVGGAGGITITNASATINSPFAAAFLDRGAAQRVGVIPEGTQIEAIGKSPAEFSNMMLIRGDGFEVFVDFQFTSVDEEQFDALPSVTTIEFQPACTAEWCTAP